MPMKPVTLTLENGTQLTGLVKNVTIGNRRRLQITLPDGKAHKFPPHSVTVTCAPAKPSSSSAKS